MGAKLPGLDLAPMPVALQEVALLTLPQHQYHLVTVGLFCFRILGSKLGYLKRNRSKTKLDLSCSPFRKNNGAIGSVWCLSGVWCLLDTMSYTNWGSWRILSLGPRMSSGWGLQAAVQGEGPARSWWQLSDLPKLKSSPPC